MPESLDLRSIPPLLPIGSVVTLKGPDHKPLMVYSRKIQTEDGTEYDYMLCPYPEGYINDDAAFLANVTDINSLLFIGFQNEREIKMREVLMRPLEETRETWDWTEY